MLNPRELTSLAVVLVLIACVWLAERVFRRLLHRQSQVASFGGGSAAAYVFLALLPELEIQHAFLGERIHLAALVGFAVLFLVDRSIEPGSQTNRRFRLEVGVAALYQFLLALTLGEALPLEAAMAAAYVLGLGLHLMQQQRGLQAALEPRHLGRARATVVGALLVGWAVHVLIEVPALVLDLLLATIAGFMMYRVFGEELSSEGRFRPGAFLAGIATFTLIHLVAGV